MAKKTAKKVTKKNSKAKKYKSISDLPKVKFKEGTTVVVELPQDITMNQLVKIEPSKNACHLLSIKQDDSLVLYSVSETGKEVLLSDNEQQFIESAFENFKKAQEMLAQLYQS